MKVRTIKKDRFNYYFIEDCCMMIKLDKWRFEVAIITLSNHITIFEDIQKVIKTKNFILLIRDNEICRAINNKGYKGVLGYKDTLENDKLITTYTMYRKLKSQGREIKVY